MYVMVVPTKCTHVLDIVNTHNNLLQQCICIHPTCFDQPYGHLQGDKIQRTNTLKIIKLNILYVRSEWGMRKTCMCGSIVYYNICIITNWMHCLSLVCWIVTHLHVLGVSTACHQEVEYIYIYICGKWNSTQPCWQST
jgi:hypothetical protein